MRAYDDIETRRIIEHAQQTYGQDFAMLRWFSDDETLRATAERNALLQDLRKGLVTNDGDDANGTKPHTGPLSPGCRICQHGGWDCSWINFRCTRNCSFCNSAPDTRTCEDRPTYCLQGPFIDPEDHVRYIQLFKKTGVGFSGGEPLLRFNILLDHLEAVRQSCDPKIYTWLYTNGDLVTRFVLKELKAAGLDEIRFNVAANDFDLDPVRLAKQFIPRVTIEIPCLPEHIELLKEKLWEMQAIGVDHLNLHQLQVGAYNFRAFMERGYHVLRNAWQTPLYESEIGVLELMRFALREGLTIPINYCSKIYKDFFQERNFRICNGDILKNPFDAYTECGYLRNVWVRDTHARIAALADHLRTMAKATQAWSVLPEQDTLCLHSDLLAAMDDESGFLKVEYFCPRVEKQDDFGPFVRENLRTERTLVFASDWLSPGAAREWRQRFLGTSPPDFNHAPVTALTEDDRTQLDRMGQYERMVRGLPEVY